MRSRLTTTTAIVPTLRGEQLILNSLESMDSGEPLTYWNLGQNPLKTSSDSVWYSPISDFLRDSELRQSMNWCERFQFQNRWTLQEKGWRVKIRHENVKGMGMGAVADQRIAKGTVIRVAEKEKNLKHFESRRDLDTFMRDFGAGTNGSLIRYSIHFCVQTAVCKTVIFEDFNHLLQSELFFKLTEFGSFCLEIFKIISL